MNVLSLPDEMLASVLKYNSFEDLTAVRKVSSKIDSVARRYGMDKLKVHRLTIVYTNNKIEMSIEIQKYTKQYRFAQPPSADLLDILKYIFSKIRGVKDLFLYNRQSTDLTKMSISNKVGEFLLGNGCKNITKLTILHWYISINFNTMRRIMTKLKLKKLDVKSSFTEFEFSDALIEGISFDSLKLSSEARAKKSLGISLPYLTRLCSLKIPSTLRCEIYNSTVSDLITFFKGLTKDMIYTIYKWELTISKGTMSVDENNQSLAKLKCFEDCEVASAKLGDITWFFIDQKKFGTSTINGIPNIIITVFP